MLLGNDAILDNTPIESDDSNTVSDNDAILDIPLPESDDPKTVSENDSVQDNNIESGLLDTQTVSSNNTGEGTYAELVLIVNQQTVAIQEGFISVTICLGFIIGILVIYGFWKGKGTK